MGNELNINGRYLKRSTTKSPTVSNSNRENGRQQKKPMQKENYGKEDRSPWKSDLNQQSLRKLLKASKKDFFQTSEIKKENNFWVGGSVKTRKGSDMQYFLSEFSSTIRDVFHHTKLRSRIDVSDIEIWSEKICLL